MINFGAVPSGAVLPIVFASFAGATGASVTLTGLAITDVEIYKGVSMTQRASDVGVVLIDTDGIDIDGVTGIHGFSIDTGDNTDAGFYAVGSFFTVVVSAVTIDSQTVNFVAATFRMAPAESVAGVPEVDLTHIAGSTTSVSTVASSVATLLADWNNGGRLDLILDIIAADTTTDIPALIATLQAYVDTEVAAILVDTGTTLQGELDGIQTTVDAILVDTAVIGALGAGLTGIPWNAAWDAEAQSECADALTAFGVSTAAAVDTIDNFLDTEVAAILAAVDTEVAAILALLDTEVPALTTSMASVLADTNELQTDWVDGGRLDLILDARASQTSVDTIDNFLDTEIADILTDTSTTLDDLIDDLEGRLTAALAIALTAHSLGIGRGVVDAGSSTTALIIKSINGAAADATNDHYNDRHIVFTSGALLLQACSITDYVGATVTATISAVTDTPAEDVTFIIV